MEVERTNHVDKNVSEEDLKTIEEYLVTCREHEGVCSESAKKYFRKHKILQFVSGLIIATGVGTTAAIGPVGIAIIGGVAFTIGFGEKMKWGDKASHCDMLAMEFGELIEDLVSCRRGAMKFDNTAFSTNLDKMERMIKKQCPKMEKTRLRWKKKHFPANFPNKKK